MVQNGLAADAPLLLSFAVAVPITIVMHVVDHTPASADTPQGVRRLPRLHLRAQDGHGSDGSAGGHMPSRGSSGTRLQGVPFWVHAVLLAVLLFGLLPLMNNGSMISADEGAVLSQMDTLNRLGEWGMPNPAAKIDPSGRWFGIDISEKVGDRYYPYAKHAAYPVLVRWLYSVGGLGLVIGASVMGTWVAALTAAALSRRVRQGLEVAALWITGLVSPLFLDSYWVIAHSLAAAAFGVAALCAIRTALEYRRDVIFVVVGCLAATALRSEAALAGISLGLACLAVGVRSRSLRWACVGCAAAGSSMAMWWLDGVFAARILGGSGSDSFVIEDRTSWLGGRLPGIWATLLRPQLLGPTPAGAAFLLITLAWVVAAAYARWRPGERGIIRSALGFALAVSVAVLVLKKAPVPGLLLAFPLVPVGLLWLRASDIRARSNAMLAITCVATSGAVIATQYSVGGSMEWGGRYFHIILPLLVPLLLVGARRGLNSLDAPTRRLACRAAAATAVALVVFMAGTVLRLHSVTEDLSSRILATAATTESANEPGGPVMVTNMEAVGRFLWREFPRSRYLRVVDSNDLDEVNDGLRRAGISEFLFAAAHHEDRDVKRFTDYAPVAEKTVEIGSWKLFVMHETSP